MSVFLVTGANGFIGHNLVKDLLNEGHHVTALYHTQAGNIPKSSSINIVQGDIRDTAIVQNLMRQVDGCYHTAGFVSSGCEKEPELSYDINVNGSRNIFEAAAQHGKPVIYLSTAAVYGCHERQSSILNETGPLLPTTLYGHQKLMIENIAREMAHTRGLKSCGIRPFNVYGPGFNTKTIFGAFINAAIQGKDIEVIDNNNVRDLLHIDDLINILKKALKIADEHGPILNAGTGMSYTNRDLAEEIIRAADSNSKIQMISNPGISLAYNGVASTESLTRSIGAVRFILFANGIKDYMKSQHLMPG